MNDLNSIIFPPTFLNFLLVDSSKIMVTLPTEELFQYTHQTCYSKSTNFITKLYKK